MSPVIEIRPSGQWIDITSDHLGEAGVSDTRGRKSESGTASTSYEFVLRNPAGKYSSDVPGSTYYRTLGRGTPIRIRDRFVRDPFSRTTSSSWGSTPALFGEMAQPVLAWTNGSGSATDYSTTGTMARHTLTTTATARQSRLDVRFSRVVVKASVAVGATATGASARAALVVRKDDNGTAHFRAELEFDTSGTVTARLVRLLAGTSATQATAVLGAYTPGQKWYIEVVAIDNRLAMKAHTGVEPADWTCTAAAYTFRKGQIALRSVRDTGNTNTNLTVDFDDLDILIPDFYGEIWTMLPMAGQGGTDLTMSVQAGGIRQRLSNTDKALRSAMYRSILNGVYTSGPPVAYWPLEDGKLATSLEQAIAGVEEGNIAQPVTLASDSTLPGSAALPVCGPGGTLNGHIPAFSGFDAATDDWTLSMLVRIDDKPASGESVIARWHTYGEVSAYEVAIDSTGLLIFRGLHPTGLTGAYVWTDSQTFDAGGQPDDASLYGRWVVMTMTNFGSAGLYEVDLQWAAAGDPSDGRSHPGGFLNSPSTASVKYEPRGTFRLWGPPTGVRGFGHHVVWGLAGAGIFTVTQPYGWRGETAIDRLVRVCDEDNLAFTPTTTSREPATVELGPQPTGGELDVLEDCSEADVGILVEDRHELGFVYRARTTLYNQVPQVEFDLSAGQLADGLRVIRDDASGLANVVTATRPGGTRQTSSIADGDVFHLTTETPPDGIGTVEASIAPNVETDLHSRAQAGWGAHLRAFRDPRFEGLKVRLHAPPYTTTPQLAADAKSLSEGDLVRLSNPPLWWRQTIPPGPHDLMVQGIARQRDGIRDEITLTCTAGAAWEVWNVDNAGADLVVAIDSDDLTLSVSTEVGPEWQTNPPVPYGIAIDGEALSVTGCTTDTPAFIAAGTAAAAVNASVSPGLPAGMTPDVGQSMFLMAAIRNSGTGTPDQPAGWATVVDNGCMKAFHKHYVTGDVAPTVTFTGGVALADTQARIVAFSGLSRRSTGASSTALSLWRNPGPVNLLNGSAQNVAYPAWYSHGRANNVVMIFAWKQDDATGYAPPAGFTEMIDNSTTTGDDSSIAAYYQVQSTSASVAAGSIVVTGGAAAISRGTIVAFRPLQTFTVERSVNGVVASHSANADIHVWRHGAVPL